MSCACSSKTIDIEELNNKYDTIISSKILLPTTDDCLRFKPMIDDILKQSKMGKCNAQYMSILKRKYTFNHKNSFAYFIYDLLVKDGTYEESIEDYQAIRRALKIKKGKSHSGVLVITIFTSPYPEYIDDDGVKVKQEFTCSWNCHYCPNEPGQPRSYLKGEPGVMRANRNEFDCIRQMHDRMNTLYNIGHPVDKLEVIVLGGTWASYPLKYREEFCRDIYYAANIFGREMRNKLSIDEEKDINRRSHCRVIGLTLETRPDTINKEEIKRLRKYGCTRVQLGIQHIDEDVLETINRRCTTDDTANAIALLKDNGFKVDGHWMPNLPGSTYAKDKNMFIDNLLATKGVVKRYVNNSTHYEEYAMARPDLQVDQWKVYPCAVVPWTEIEKWYKEGTYKPYGEEELIDVIVTLKTLMFPWIRLNRIIRDIPADYIFVDGDVSNMRQDAQTIMKREGTKCMCIRCREVKNNNINGCKQFVVRKYDSSDGYEYFLSYETSDRNILFGFLRLRINKGRNNIAFPEILECSFIRELHVYGQLQEVGKYNRDAVQHKGIGKTLVNMAVKITREYKIKKMAVIAGEGTKEYYGKLGFIDDNGDGGYMIKPL